MEVLCSWPFCLACFTATEDELPGLVGVSDQSDAQWLPQKGEKGEMVFICCSGAGIEKTKGYSFTSSALTLHP